MGVRSEIRHTSPEQLRERLDAFESHYGIPSERLAEAFRNSPLNENAHFLEWSTLFAAWRVSVAHS